MQKIIMLHVYLNNLGELQIILKLPKVPQLVRPMHEIDMGRLFIKPILIVHTLLKYQYLVFNLTFVVENKKLKYTRYTRKVDRIYLTSHQTRQISMIKLTFSVQYTQAIYDIISHDYNNTIIIIYEYKDLLSL